MTETRWELTTVLITPSKTVNGRAFMSLDPERQALVNVSINNLMTEPIVFNRAFISNNDA